VKRFYLGQRTSLRNWATLTLALLLEEPPMTEISRLPGPVMDLWDWQYEGACREADPTLFFHPEGERGSARRRRAASAKAVCANCPVLKECREHSLAVREP
jgi:WhiB family transcriptional regulator, redox-sensing transcriptional regulator